MQNFNGNGGYGNKPMQQAHSYSVSNNTMPQKPIGQQSMRPVQNLATGGTTQVVQTTAQKKRVKVAAGWNGQYGPQVTLDIAALHAISRLLLEQGIESGSLRLRFYANNNKLNPKAPDFTFVASEVFGIYMTGQGYQDLELRPQTQSNPVSNNAMQPMTDDTEEAPF